MAKTLTGVVSSNKTDKTIVVTVLSAKTHPLYKKKYSSRAKFMAHDEKNAAEIGDKVIIAESRPLSKRKRFTLQEIITKPLIREMATLADEPVVDVPKPKTDEPTTNKSARIPKEKTT